MDAPVIDLTIVDDIRGINREDADVYAELLGIFARDAPARIAGIRSATDAAGRAGEAHRLRGSSATMGFARLSQACGALEEASDAAVADRRALVDAVVDAYAEVVLAIRDL